MYPEGGDLVAGVPNRVYVEAFTPAKTNMFPGSTWRAVIEKLCVPFGGVNCCWMKHGHLYAWYRISALKVKIGCKR